MAKASKKVEKVATLPITSFFPRKSSSSPPKKSSLKPTLATGSQGKASASPRMGKPYVLIESSLSRKSHQDNMPRQRTAPMASSANSPSTPLPAPRKTSMKRKAVSEAVDSDASDSIPTRPTRVCVSKGKAPATSRNVSDASSHHSKRLRSSPDVDEVPGTESEEEVMQMPIVKATSASPLFSAADESSRSCTPPPQQQHTPPHTASSDPPYARPFDSPGTTKTRQIVEQIKRQAQAKAMSSPEPADPTFDFNQYDIEDSSEEDDGDVLLAMTANKKGKGKAKVNPFPPTRKYALRGHSSPDEGDGSSAPPRRTRQPTRGPVVLTKASAPTKKVSNPLHKLLQEKRQNENQNRGEVAREQAEREIARKRMMDEVNADEFDDDSLFRTTDPFGLNTPPAEIEETGERLLGDKRGKAVHGILRSDKEAAQLQEQIFGISLWANAIDAMDSDLQPPVVGNNSNLLLHSFADAVASHDDAQAALILSCGLLCHSQLRQDETLVSYIATLACSCLDGPLPEAAFIALFNAWNTTNVPVKGLKASVAISALQSMGLSNELVQLMGWQAMDPSNSPTCSREDSIRRLIRLISKSASARLTPVDDVLDELLLLSLLSLDQECPKDRTSALVIAVNDLCNLVHQVRTVNRDLERSIVCKLVSFVKMLEPINQVHVLSLFGSGTGQSHRIAQIAAHCILTENDQPPNDNGLPSLMALLDVVSSTGKSSVFKVKDDADYIVMGYRVQILAIAVTDIDAYVREERKANMGQKDVLGSPLKAGEKVQTPVELLRSALEKLHSRIVDTRAAKLERSRTKAALKSLSMRIYYQHQSSTRSENRQGQTSLKAFLVPHSSVA